MVNDWIYDIETYPNCFLLTAELAHLSIGVQFEISDWCNDSSDIVHFLNALKDHGDRMVGFNNLGFDYPVIHTLVRMGHSDANTLYQKAMAIITAQDDENGNSFAHQVYPSDRHVDQLDLFKIHHFDNRARSTSLKVLEFNMRADNIKDLPFPVGTILTREQIDVLKKYNRHDVTMTKKFYLESLDMIRFREELTQKYQRDFMNHNDTKIGKDYFVMKLEEAGVPVYEYGANGRTPRQTKRPTIALRDAILPWISFRHPEFNRVLDWLTAQTITETKGVFKDLVARVEGFDFVFGLGGIHGSIESETVYSSIDYVIVDLDVKSYYPNLAISNRFYPAHLGETFCDIYKHLFKQRSSFTKGSAENAMLKLALNGVYGDSNNPFSVFYDPLFTMSITLNGQLLLCMLAERLMTIEGLQIIQVNTDGVTVRLPRRFKDLLQAQSAAWQNHTKLELEEVEYEVMHIRDVNNYIAKTVGGKVKRKGAYEYEMEWHQDHSALVIPKVAERVLIHGDPIRETVMSWPNKMDFMIRVKVPRSSYLSIDMGEVGGSTKLQNTTRYYIAQAGGKLTKWMPPLKGKTEWRQISVESGWSVCVCNDIKDAVLDIDYQYYIQEVEKLVLGVM